jgi:ribosomal protein S18 acetylase RimI-like enzyme
LEGLKFGDPDIVSAHDQNGGTATPVITREMRLEDIDGGLRLCRASGWNQLADDWHLFLRLSPDGCRVAEGNGEVVGTVAALRYQDRFSWVAMMLVDPQHRRAGIGRRLLSEALDLLGDETSIRLDATPVGRELYRRYGFQDEYALSRFAREAGRRQPDAASERVRPMRQQDLAEIFAFDRQAFGADRSAILNSLFERSPNYAWVTEPTISHSGIQGYCFGRTGFRYHQLGPVVARDERIAREVLATCLRHNGGVCFGIDAPQQSQSWLDWLIEQGFFEERPFVRMYRGNMQHAGEVGSVFAIVGPEFG